MYDKPTPEPIQIPDVDTFSYKDVEILRRFVTPQGYIVPRSRTGLSQKRQRQLARAIKWARHLALLPFTQTL